MTKSALLTKMCTQYPLVITSVNCFNEVHQENKNKYIFPWKMSFTISWHTPLNVNMIFWFMYASFLHIYMIGGKSLFLYYVLNNNAELTISLFQGFKELISQSNDPLLEPLLCAHIFLGVLSSLTTKEWFLWMEIKESYCDISNLKRFSQFHNKCGSLELGIRNNCWYHLGFVIDTR